MTECDEVISIMDNVSTKKSNSIARNVTSTASIKERDIYILNSFNMDHISIDNYYYLLFYIQNKKIQYKMGNNEF